VKIYIIEELKDGKHWNDEAFWKKTEAIESVKKLKKSRKESKFVMRTYDGDRKMIEVRYF